MGRNMWIGPQPGLHLPGGAPSGIDATARHLYPSQTGIPDGFVCVGDYGPEDSRHLSLWENLDSAFAVNTLDAAHLRADPCRHRSPEGHPACCRL